MSKSKMIAIVVWLITIILPFKAGFVDQAKPDMFTLTMFILTLIGIATGAFFFSRTESPN